MSTNSIVLLRRSKPQQDPAGRGVRVTVYGAVGANEIRIGIAVHKNNANFRKSIGRKIAFGRAIAKPDHIFPRPEDVKEVYTVFKNYYDTVVEKYVIKDGIKHLNSLSDKLDRQEKRMDKLRTSIIAQTTLAYEMLDGEKPKVSEKSHLKIVHKDENLQVA